MLAGSALVHRYVPSPNGRGKTPTDVWKYVIIHGTWMENTAAALARLTDPASEVSCHYLVDEAGCIVQLVGEDKVAWHAGKSAWGTDEMLNGKALGIELSNNGSEPYTEAQYTALIALLQDILARHNTISPAGILGHSEVSPGRKTDPGPYFDWARLVAAGVALPRPLVLLT